jgi:galactose oxidase
MLVVLLTLAALSFLGFQRQSSAEVVRTGYTTFVAGNSGKCLDVLGASTSAGSAVVQSHCTFASDQQWTVTASGTPTKPSFEIVQQQTGFCLDNQSSTSTAQLVVNPCTGTSNQLWTFMSVGHSANFGVSSVLSGMCVNVSGMNSNGDTFADGASVVQDSCANASNYYWTPTSGIYAYPAYAVLQATHSGQCLVVNGTTAQNATVIQSPCSGVAGEQWTFYPYGRGYAIVSAGSGLCLTVVGTGVSATLTQGSCSGSVTDQWYLKASVNGSYQVVSQTAGGLCLTVPNASQTAGAAIGLFNCKTTQNELWVLSNAVLHSSWSNVIPLPVDPIAAANLPNGTVMTWATDDPYTWEPDIDMDVSGTYTNIFDPVALTSTEVAVTNTQADMFCPGTANLFDGRILANGGSSSPRTSIFTPSTNTWAADALMNIPRGYEGDTVLTNGSVLTLGGSWNDTMGNKTAEVWTSGSGWSVLSGVPETLIEGNDPDGIFRSDNHLWLFAAPNGNVFHAGPSAQMNWITTSGNGSITPAGNRGDDAYAINGKAMLYDAGMILKTGGAPSYDTSTQYVTSQAGTYTININSNTPVVTKLAPMAFPRAFANGVVLPSGQTVIVGGQTVPAPFSDTNTVLIPEIWDPATLVFRQLSPMQTPRNYHSTAILLKDGRVFAGGGGQCGEGCSANHFNTEILSPPYLFNPDGSLATQPVISAAPTTGTLGQTISVTTSTPVVSFVLMRLSSTTHTVNNDQRRVPLQMVSATDGNNYTLTIPSNPGIALPGAYWLFALNAQGVPSVGSSILIN